MADDDFLAHLDDTITIFRPHHTVVPRGNASPLKNLQTVSIRLPEPYREDITVATTLLGMPRSEFMRWCAYHVAREIIRKKVEYDKLKRK